MAIRTWGTAWAQIGSMIESPYPCTRVGQDCPRGTSRHGEDWGGPGRGQSIPDWLPGPVLEPAARPENPVQLLGWSFKRNDSGEAGYQTNSWIFVPDVAGATTLPASSRSGRRGAGVQEHKYIYILISISIHNKLYKR